MRTSSSSEKRRNACAAQLHGRGRLRDLAWAASAAVHYGLAAPLDRVDVTQSLRQHPPVAERVDEAGLAFSVRPVLRAVIRVGTAGSGRFEHAVDVRDAEHDLAGRAGRLLVVSQFAHDQLGALAVDTELRPVTPADANMLDEPEHAGVPGDRSTHVIDRQYRNDRCPWRGAVRHHASRSHRHPLLGHPLCSARGRRVRGKAGERRNTAAVLSGQATTVEVTADPSHGTRSTSTANEAGTPAKCGGTASSPARPHPDRAATSSGVPTMTPAHRVLAADLPAHVGRTVTLEGWLHRRRRLKTVTFLVLRDRSGLAQVVLHGMDGVHERLPEETVLRVTGRAVANVHAPGGVEVVDAESAVLSEPDARPPFDLYRPAPAATLPVVLDAAPVALRHPRLRAPFEIAAAAVRGFRAELDAQGFTEVFTPKVTGTATESGADVFELDWFGRPAYLAQSPQFFKQAMVGVLRAGLRGRARLPRRAARHRAAPRAVHEPRRRAGLRA